MEDFCGMRYARFFLFLIVMYGAVPAFSQYYYNDIIALQQSQKQYALLVANHVSHVSAVSYNGTQPADNFKLEQQISPDANKITTTSGDPSSGDLFTINTYSKGRLTVTRDSSDHVLSVTRYNYDASGNISSIITSSDDAFMNSHSEEIHQWIYNGNAPEKMLRIKDKTDTTIITFTYDAGNVAQETRTRKGQTTETYYYYYNTKNELTDIVRYNSRVQKMLPDFLFEYNNAGNISQMMQVPGGSSDYLIWKYTYNGSGLKERELLYNKQQELIGSVVYKYE